MSTLTSIAGWSLRRRVAIVAGITAASMAVVRQLGAMGGAVALAPALAAGVLLGMRGGLLWSGLTCVFMNGLLVVLHAGPWSRSGRWRPASRMRSMAYVLSNLEFALEGLREPNVDLSEVRQALDEARQGTNRVLSIVTDMRSLSRGTDEELRPVDVPATIRSALNLASGAMKHSVTLKLELGPVPEVLATEARLGQVVLNLVVNAAQAMPQRIAGANQLRVATRTDEAGRAVIEVHDNGTGIPRDVAARTFDPFFTTKPPGVGTGLGLSICHSIVATLGGELSFVTEVGQGTTFRVVLPPAVGLAAPRSSMQAA